MVSVRVCKDNLLKMGKVVSHIDVQNLEAETKQRKREASFERQ